jgi:hypothetical protein
MVNSNAARPVTAKLVKVSTIHLAVLGTNANARANTVLLCFIRTLYTSQ